jgi:hypothetical protein
MSKKGEDSTNEQINKLSLMDKEDFYIEKGFIVFTERYHLKRGNCCRSGCRHCPYPPVK